MLMGVIFQVKTPGSRDCGGRFKTLYWWMLTDLPLYFSQRQFPTALVEPVLSITPNISILSPLSSTKFIRNRIHYKYWYWLKLPNTHQSSLTTLPQTQTSLPPPDQVLDQTSRKSRQEVKELLVGAKEMKKIRSRNYNIFFQRSFDHDCNDYWLGDSLQWKRSKQFLVDYLIRIVLVCTHYTGSITYINIILMSLFFIDVTFYLCLIFLDGGRTGNMIQTLVRTDSVQWNAAREMRTNI